MTALRWALSHPDNRGQPVKTLARWAFHNARRRVSPSRELSRRLGSDGIVTGPIGHPVINLMVYARTGFYDFDAMRSLQLLLERGDTFIDIGANIGVYSILASSVIGSTGSILAFEPAESEIPFLHRNLATAPARSIVRTVPLADRKRRVHFVTSGPTTGHVIENLKSTQTTSTLDHELTSADLSVTTDSFAKLDVEGWEPAVVLGARDWLSTRPRGLLIEANGLNQSSPVPWNEAVRFLRESGYEFTWPTLQEGILTVFDDPDPRSPSDNYLVLRPDVRRRLAQAADLRTR